MKVLSAIQTNFKCIYLIQFLVIHPENICII